MTPRLATPTPLQLFHHPGSSCSRRVALTALLLELPIEHRLIDLHAPRSRDLLATMNPNKKIPVLVEGDFVLWESHAIMQYLCSKVTGQTLYPSAAKARANVDRWLFWIAQHLSPPIGAINFERMIKRFLHAGDPDGTVIAGNEVQFRSAAALLEQVLDARSWVAGDTMTLADLSLAAALMHAEVTQLPVADYPHLAKLVTRIYALPEWTATAAASAA